MTERKDIVERLHDEAVATALTIEAGQLIERQRVLIGDQEVTIRDLENKLAAERLINEMTEAPERRLRERGGK